MGAVETTYTFQATDTITSTKMNNIIDETIMTGDAILGTTLAIASNRLKVNSQGITSNELAENSVTSTKIFGGSVDPSKLSTGYPSWTTSGNLTVNGATTALSSITANTASVSIGSARTASGASVIDFNSTFPLTSYEARISRESGTNGNLVISNTGSGSIKFNDIPLGPQAGTAPIYGVRAWAKLNPYITGNIRTHAYKSGNYSRTLTETTVTITDHGLKTNDKIRLDFTSGTGTDGLYTVTSSANSSQFVVNHTGAVTSGTVTAQFVQIQGAGNVSTASFYDSADDQIVLNFITPMPNVNYATMVTGQLYPTAWFSMGTEGSIGDTQLNTIYQAFVAQNESTRFLSVSIVG
jgi:hypothetical protein